jgi:hypothetical protein
MWTLLILSGGYFAGMVVDACTGQILVHKTMHKYTQRKKQGFSQTKHDQQTGHKASSVGAQLRRENEAKLQVDVMDLLDKWKDWITMSDRVFVKVAYWQRDVFTSVRERMCKFRFIRTSQRSRKSNVLLQS